MENLIVKLEKYANNLEDIVNQRTAELLVEKQKTDTQSNLSRIKSNQ